MANSNPSWIVKVPPPAWGVIFLAIAWLIGLATWGIKLGTFVLGLCAIQTTLGRVPHRRLPDLIGVAALLALLAAIMVLASVGTA